jgi:tetratricopeptide (TPR) repeat protein
MAQNPLLAGRFLDDVLEEVPDDVATLVSYSQALRGLRGKAYTIAERALGLDPSDVGANVRMAELIVSRCMEDIAALCRRNWDDAAALYRTALKLDPERVDAAFGLGVVYVHTGKPGDAINYLRVAHRLAPWAPRINYYLGEAYRLTGNEALAKLHLKKTYHWDASEDWRKRARISLSLLSVPY